jgi:hypothetical protein
MARREDTQSLKCGGVAFLLDEAGYPDTEPVKSPAEPMVRGLSAGGRRIRTCMGLFLSSVFLVCWRFFVRSGKALLRPVAYDQVRRARGRGQGTETLAELSGLPLSRACVSQRLDA